MIPSRTSPPSPDSPATTGALLRHARAAELLAAALAPSNLRLEGFVRTNWFNRPGAEASAIYRVQASGRELHLIASTLELSPAEREALGAVRLDGSEGTVHIWPHPADPALPGLPVACDPTALGRRLSHLWGEETEVIDLRMRVLRPLRRAVLQAEVTSGGHRRRIFLKVVRPYRAAELLHRHTLCPPAPTAADAGDGIVVLQEAPGMSLVSHLYRAGGDDRQVPHIETPVLFEALTTTSEDALRLPPRPAPAEKVEAYAGTCIQAGAAPTRIDALLQSIAPRLLPEPGPVTVTHGDFHGANIHLDATGRQISALIDVDTLGPGRAADDSACLLAHLLVLPSISPQGYTTAPPLTRRVWNHAATRHDPEDLTVRTAAVLMSLAAGARTALHRDLWLMLAETLCMQGASEALRRSEESVMKDT